MKDKDEPFYFRLLTRSTQDKWATNGPSSLRTVVVGGQIVLSEGRRSLECTRKDMKDDHEMREGHGKKFECKLRLFIQRSDVERIQ